MKKLFYLTVIVAVAGLLIFSCQKMSEPVAPIAEETDVNILAKATSDPMIELQFVGVTAPDLWGRTYDQWKIIRVDGSNAVWYRVTEAQGFEGNPVVESGTSNPGSAWTATGFTTDANPKVVKLLKHINPGDPFAREPYKTTGWDANPRQICVEYSNGSQGPWSGPICDQVPIMLARGECVDLGQIRLCFVGISQVSEPDAYRNTKKGWYCWRIEYIQGDDWTKSCWFEVQPPSFATAFPYSGFVRDNPTFMTRKVWTAAAEIKLKWTGKNQTVKNSPNTYGPITAYAVY